MAGSLRSAEQWTRYEKHKAAGGLGDGCPLCAEPKNLKVFEHWRLVHAEFPYDKIAKVHDMIIPKRHVAEEGLSPEEKRELAQIKEEYINENYDFIIEAAQKNKSIPAHFHLHLIIPRD